MGLRIGMKIGGKLKPNPLALTQGLGATLVLIMGKATVVAELKESSMAIVITSLLIITPVKSVRWKCWP